ncbi:MAG: hypothetical protein WD273_00155 [Trueperaceae bacterium]
MLRLFTPAFSVLAATLLLACTPQERTVAQSQWDDTWQTAPQPRLSAGCSVSNQPLAPATVTVRGQQRSFISRVPQYYAPGMPHDLVIAFHGRTNPNTRVRGYYELDEALPMAIIAYPSASRFESGFRWSDPGDAVAELRDFELFDALVEAFSGSFCVDLDRVFVVGHSLGASFANSVACHRGATVRAVASVAGGIEGRECDGGAAALLIHHPDDLLVPLSEGIRVRNEFIAANGLELAPSPTSEPDLTALGCVRYGSGSLNPVVWCVHDQATTIGGRYYPHNWPNATPRAIARFFADLP